MKSHLVQIDGVAASLHHFSIRPGEKVIKSFSLQKPLTVQIRDSANTFGMRLTVGALMCGRGRKRCET